MVKVAEVVGLPEEEAKEEVGAGLLVEEEGAGLQEEVVVVVAAGMRVEQLKIGGERYLLNFFNTYVY